MKSIFRSLVAITIACAGFASAGNAASQMLRIANQGDVLSLDPHSLNESLQLNVMSNVYEPLIGRNKDQSLAPLLAANWRQISTNVWYFELRKNVQFHDGKPLTPEDVIFSFARASGESSDMKSNTLEIKEVRKVGDNAVEIETKFPFPTLPDSITELLIVSRKWSEENEALLPVDRRTGVENTASFRANGTGPYRVRERQPNVRTVFSAMRPIGERSRAMRRRSYSCRLPIRSHGSMRCWPAMSTWPNQCPWQTFRASIRAPLQG